MQTVFQKTIVFSLVGSAIFFGNSALAQVRSNYNLEFKGRYAQNLIRKQENQSHRVGLEFHQNSTLSNWKFRFGFQSVAEGAPGANPDRFTSDYIQRNSSWFIPRDIFAEYLKESFFIRVGYQQVVWGEAFGSFFADVINPKDLRDGGLNSLYEQRLQIPILNIKWIEKFWSAQLVLIPWPQFNKNPSRGSPFLGDSSPNSPKLADLVLSESGSRGETLSAEVGLRTTFLVGAWDYSVFGFQGYDRNPYVTTQFDGVQAYLQPRSLRYNLFGVTATKDFSSVLLRAELIRHVMRPFQSFENLVFSYKRADQLVSVLGLDFTQLESWQAGIQIAIDDASGDLTAIERKKQVSLLQGRLAQERKTSRLELSASISSDGGNLLQSVYTYFMSKAAELDLGVDVFGGGSDSATGRARDASRYYITIRMKDSG
jgi:hypothetical protein